MYGKVFYLNMIAPRFHDELVKKLLDIDDNLTLTMHMQTLDPIKAIKMLKVALSDIQKMKIEEQKKAVRSGYDMDILPTDIVTYEKDTLELLDDLNTSNQKLIKMMLWKNKKRVRKPDTESVRHYPASKLQSSLFAVFTGTGAYGFCADWMQPYRNFTWPYHKKLRYFNSFLYARAIYASPCDLLWFKRTFQQYDYGRSKKIAYSQWGNPWHAWKWKII